MNKVFPQGAYSVVKTVNAYKTNYRKTEQNAGSGSESELPIGY